MPRTPLNGWLILDKPEGPSSTQALGKVKRVFQPEKAGHGGTLDPLASGILPIAFGEATKLISFAMDGIKTYRFTVRWGEARTTGDREGDISATSPTRPDAAAIHAVLPQFLGTIFQMPPAYSALKINGERAYDLARRGEEVNLAPRQITIHSLRLEKMDDADHSTFEVTCGKGTYIRSLGQDIAEKLGTFGHLSYLRRLRVGPFDESHAISLEKLESFRHKDGAFGAEPEGLLQVAAALDDIPALHISEQDAQRLRYGQDMLLPRLPTDLSEGAPFPVFANGTLVALATWSDGRVKSMRGFNL
jgi:tRNA pseudouridine55 synthase